MFESLKKFFAGKMSKPGKETELPENETELQAKNRQELNEQRRNIARIEAETLALKMESFKTKATARAKAFALESVKSGRIFTAEKAGLEQNYIQAAIDDEIIPLADGSKRVEKLENQTRARQPHGFNQELLAGPPISDNGLKIIGGE
jgi:hypothetical protein